jgi:hypothetical protein
MDEAVRGDGAENKVTAPVPGIDMAEGETFIAAASPVLVTVIMTIMNSPSETVSDEADMAEASAADLWRPTPELKTGDEAIISVVLSSVPVALVEKYTVPVPRAE